MLFYSSRLKQPFQINTDIRVYCRKSTEEFIKKLTERYNLEKKNKLAIKFTDDDPKINVDSVLSFFLFLSVTTIAYQFCKRFC
jgi:hypothetical protein